MLVSYINDESLKILTTLDSLLTRSPRSWCCVIVEDFIDMKMSLFALNDGHVSKYVDHNPSEAFVIVTLLGHAE